jgi:hypothetical protein
MRVELWVRRVWIVWTLGRKPNSGGIPPSARNVRAITILMLDGIALKLGWDLKLNCVNRGIMVVITVE